MSLKHPQTPPTNTRDLAVDPMLTMNGHGIPRHRMPSGGETEPEVAYQIVHDELMLDGNARMNLATFVTTWMEPQAQRLMAESLRQEHDRQGRVPADRRARVAVRRDPQPALARARRGAGHRLLHDRLERGGDARRPRPQAPLAAGAARRGQAGRPAEPRHGHQRPGLLGEVRQLLGRRDAPGPDGGRAVQPLGRGGREALRREHHRGGRDPRLDVRRVLRAGRRDLRRPRRPAGAHRPRHPGARRRRVRGVRRPVHRPRPRLGLHPAPRRLDQRLGPQVRPRLPRRRLDHLARRRRAARPT